MSQTDHRSEAETAILSSVRPANWTPAEVIDYQDTQRLLDQALTACAHQRQSLLDATMPRARDAQAWHNAYRELAGIRAALRPDQRSLVRQTRTRCTTLLEDSARLTEIRTAISSGRAKPFTPEADMVRHKGAWWVRNGLSYARLDPRAPLVQELTRRLTPALEMMAAADHAVRQHRQEPA